MRGYVYYLDLINGFMTSFVHGKSLSGYCIIHDGEGAKQVIRWNFIKFQSSRI